MDFLSFDVTTVVGLVAITTAAAEFIDRFWDLEGTASQIRAVFVAMVLCTLGSFFNIGLFADEATGAYMWYVEGPLVGLYVGVISNVIFLTPVVKSILELLKIRPKQEKTP